ncbi:NUDIX hydrolase [Salinigranum sp. GCM10025319]|uniref:NUDIX hydrolase n=1 Tax=Salinigranum sp. GCM10025319 TaxID=3252687 RepID=UPI00360AB19D
MVARIPSYCPDCGTALTTVEREGRSRKRCASCDRIVYRNPVPGAGVVVVDGDRVLLVRRRIDPGVGKWCDSGGHLEVDEPPAVAAARELEEETGLAVDAAALTLVDAVAMEPWGEKHVVSMGYAVRRSETTGRLSPGTDADAARFVGRDDLSELEFAFDYVADRVERALALFE